MTASKRNLAKRMASLARQRDGYAALLEVAKQHGMEYEIERLSADLAEFEGEYDDAIFEAIERGFGPEDFE